LKDDFEKRTYIVDKFNVRTTFLNSYILAKRVLYISTYA